jgi:hypothetical protein
MRDLLTESISQTLGVNRSSKSINMLTPKLSVEQAEALEDRIIEEEA